MQQYNNILLVTFSIDYINLLFNKLNNTKHYKIC